MKERVTFVHAQGADLDPKLLKVSKDGLAGPAIKTTREDRLTIPLEELPPGIQQTLMQLSQLNVRWSSPRLYDTEEAFSARTSPGFHVSLAQARVEGLTGDDSLPVKQVQMMLRVFEKCDIKDVKSFSKLKVESDPDTDYFYFYQPMDTLKSFGKATADVFCDKEDEVCKARMNSFGDASTLDVKYDSVSRAAKLTIMWAPKEQSLNVAANKKRRVEVGILEQGAAANQESYESGLSGLLTVLGENKEPSPVLFNFPARHRKTTDTFTASFPPPTGIHPTLQLSVSSSTSPNPDGKCSPHAYLTLPNVIFADRYQLADSLFLASKNLTGTPQISTPVDLEAPAYNTSTWGSNALVQLAPPKDTKGPFTSEIPLHLRYVAPKDSGGQAIELPYPIVFWACEPVAEADLSKSPFDNAHLGYDDLFPQGTTFWHVNPKPESGDRITSQLVVPALEEEAASTIAFGTAAVVILGFTWVLWKVIRGVVANGYGTRIAVEEKKEDKKKK